MTALIKTWHFLEGISSPLVKKKGEAETGLLYASRCDAFKEDVSLPSMEKKGDRGAAALFGENIRALLSCLCGKLTYRRYL